MKGGVMSNPIKLFIATPMFAGMCTGSYTQSLINTANLMKNANIQVAFSFLFNESLITRARNSLTHAFLKSDSTHLMFIDSDIRFDPQDIITMLNADKDVICGIYPKKEINWNAVQHAMQSNVPIEHMKYCTGSFVVNLAGYESKVTVPVDQPVEIWNGGTGFMLIKRSVFEKLKTKVPAYSNDVMDLSGNLGYAEKIHEYFTTSIEKGTNRLLSEDYHFCNLWRKHKGKIYAAPWVRLAHIGTYTFEGQLLQAPVEPAPEAKKSPPKKAGTKGVPRRRGK
jgi:hypothetical protein